MSREMLKEFVCNELDARGLSTRISQLAARNHAMMDTLYAFIGEGNVAVVETPHGTFAVGTMLVERPGTDRKAVVVYDIV